MARKVKVTVLNSTENKYKITLTVGGVVQDHTLITAAELRTSKGVVLADSEVDATDWDFTNQGFILVKLGLTELPVGEHTCYLITKDSAHSIGLGWDTEIILTVLP